MFIRSYGKQQSVKNFTVKGNREIDRPSKVVSVSRWLQNNISIINLIIIMDMMNQNTSPFSTQYFSFSFSTQ